MSDHLPLILSYLAAIGFGGIVAAVVNHRFASGRESRAKRDDFRGFLGRWLGQIEEFDPAHENAVWEAYTSNLVHLKGYVAKLNKDFSRQSKFRELCTSLSSIKRGDVSAYLEQDSRKEIVDRIHRLIDFV